MKRRAAFTIFEALIVIVMVGILLAAVHRLFASSVDTSKRVLGTLDAQQRLRYQMQKLVHDLQGSKRLFFPKPGGKTEPGVGFVDERGRSIMVFARETDGQLQLYRADLDARTREVVAEDLASFRVTVPKPPDGIEPRTVNVTLGLNSEGTENEAGEKRPVLLATSVTLRALERRYPD
jgi:type II secretory pathway pseudopilin PulG